MAIDHLRAWGPTVVLSDGDVVFQPRKVERRHPAEHYVLVDDKLRILAAAKPYRGARLRTVFVRQGHYARDPSVGTCPPADVTIERIGELLDCDLPALQGAGKEHTA